MGTWAHGRMGITIGMWTWAGHVHMRMRTGIEHQLDTAGGHVVLERTWVSHA